MERALIYVYTLDVRDEINDMRFKDHNTSQKSTSEEANRYHYKTSRTNNRRV